MSKTQKSLLSFVLGVGLFSACLTLCFSWVWGLIAIVAVFVGCFVGEVLCRWKVEVE